MLCLTVLPVEPPRQPPIGLGRDSPPLPDRFRWPDHLRFGVECLVGDQCVGRHVRQQVIGAGQIVNLPAGQMEADGIAKRIHQGIDLRAQP